jgi:hypothetical protein
MNNWVGVVSDHTSMIPAKIKMGHTQRKLVPWNNSCIMIVSCDYVYDFQNKAFFQWNHRFQFYETDLMKLVSFVCGPPKTVCNLTSTFPYTLWCCMWEQRQLHFSPFYTTETNIPLTWKLHRRYKNAPKWIETMCYAESSHTTPLLCRTGGQTIQGLFLAHSKSALIASYLFTEFDIYSPQ